MELSGRAIAWHMQGLGLIPGTAKKKKKKNLLSQA
jgi:hypothetical protein